MYGIDINNDLQSSIIKQDSAEFFKKLLHLVKLTLQLRNSKIGTDVDYMISPVSDRNGTFFNSETCGENLPKNADANGAYNIARKGLYLVRQIKKQEDLSKLKLGITNKEWLNFIQNEEYLN
jgi:CRISPR-associated protein Cpf1